MPFATDVLNGQRDFSQTGVDGRGEILGSPNNASVLRDELSILEYNDALRQGVLSLRTFAQTPLSAYVEILRDLESFPPSEESDELGRLAPSQYGLETARSILFRMLELGAKIPKPKEISVDRDGAVRVLWETEDRAMELVCPYAQNQRPYVFFSDDLEHRIGYELSKILLHRLLSWLNGAATDFPK